jgi:hypothetical protein
MGLNKGSLALTFGLLWGGALFVVGLANLIEPTYGVRFLEVVASVYPGYSASGSFGQVVIGTLYALLDGLVGGWIFAWLYNLLSSSAS